MILRTQYHFSVRRLYRSLSESAAYITGTRLLDVKTGTMNNFLRRGADDRDEIVHAELVLPGRRVEDLGFFVNRVVRKNNKPRAVYGRSITASIPVDLNEAEMVRYVMKYARYLATRYRVGVVVAIHRPPVKTRGHRGGSPLEEDDAPAMNWHVHFLLSYCTVDERGVLGTKQRLLDPNDCARMRVQNFCDVERVRWQDATNDALRLAGSSARADHRTLLEQGSMDLPTRYCGPSVSAMMESGWPVGTPAAPARLEPAVVTHNRLVRRRNARRRTESLAAYDDLKRHRDRRARVLAVIDRLLTDGVKGRMDELTAGVRLGALSDATGVADKTVDGTTSRSGRNKWWQAILSAHRRREVELVDRRFGVVLFTDGGAIVKTTDKIMLVQRGAFGYAIDLVDDIRHEFATQSQDDEKVYTDAAWVPTRSLRTVAINQEQESKPFSEDEQREIDRQFSMIRAVGQSVGESAVVTEVVPKAVE